MATLKQEIDSITFYAGSPNDNTLKEAVKLSILNNLSLLLRREYAQTHQFRSSSIVTLTCIDLEKVNSTECCSVDLGCKVLRTSIKIPRPVMVKDIPDFGYVGGIDLNKEISITQILPSEIEWFPYRKFSSKFPRFAYMDDRVVVLGIKTLKKIKLRYVPQDLLAVTQLGCDTNCFGEEDDIMLDNDLMAICREMVYKEIGLSPIKQTEEIQVDK